MSRHLHLRANAPVRGHGQLCEPGCPSWGRWEALGQAEPRVCTQPPASEVISFPFIGLGPDGLKQEHMKRSEASRRGSAVICSNILEHFRGRGLLPAGRTVGAGSWQGEQCCLRRGMGNEAVLPRVLSRLGQSKVTWFSVTWDPEAVGTDAPQSLSWDAGERQPPPQRSSGGCAPCRAGAGRCPQAKGSHISRAGADGRPSGAFTGEGDAAARGETGR